MNVIMLAPDDSVAIACAPLAAGDLVTCDGISLAARQTIDAGHKIAVRDIAAGEPVFKYGFPIGHATEAIRAGDWVHSHNLATNLDANLDYVYNPRPDVPVAGQPTLTFPGYLRGNGDVGVRNTLLIVPTVGCINGTAQAIARQFEQAHDGFGHFDSVVVADHPFGCSQLGGDLAATRTILQGIVCHPNAGGVLVIGLGCENNQLDALRDGLGWYDPARVKFMVAQDTVDEMDEAARLLEELDAVASADTRIDVPLSKLRVGVKCGGSDGFSGLTANPLVGQFADYLVGQGGSIVLTEVPEMFGAEQVLMSRATDQAVFEQIVAMINWFKDYFRRYDQPIYDNPSPGNKQGGITTLEEKSLGAIQKAGTSAVVDVLDYGEKVTQSGVSLLSGPGNDLVSSTALACAGCQIVLFTTGRGTPFGTFVPTVKVATNTSLVERKPSWIDFDAGGLLTEPMAQVAQSFTDLVLQTAGGRLARNEASRMQQIAIFKDGVTE